MCCWLWGRRGEEIISNSAGNLLLVSNDELAWRGLGGDPTANTDCKLVLGGGNGGPAKK